MGQDDVFCMNCGKKTDANAATDISGQNAVSSNQNQFAPDNHTTYGQSTADSSVQPGPAAYTYAQQSGHPQHASPGSPGYSQQQQVPPKKRGCVKGCLVTVIALLVIAALLFAGAFFLLPGLIRPADLGVEVSEAAYDSAHDKLGYSKDVSPQDGDRSDYIVEYSGSHPISTALTSEELTSMFGYNRSVYTRFENPQVRFNEDGTIDAAVRVNLNYVFQELLMGQYDLTDLQSVFPPARVLPATVNLQGNFAGRVVNNQLELASLNSARVQGISVPQGLLSASSTHSFVERNIDNYIQSANERTGSSYDLIEVRNQELVIEGMFPDAIARRTR